MPSQDRLRLNHLNRTEQARPEPGHPYEQDAITAAKPETRLCPPQGDVELLTKKQILRFKPTARLEQVDNEYSERAQDRKHRSQ